MNVLHRARVIFAGWSRWRQRTRPLWDRWYRLLLPAYWIFLFTVTHLPRLNLTGVGVSDKEAHFVAYGLLAFLFWRFVEALTWTVNRRFVWIAGVILLFYAAIDEYLQSFVGRSTDIMDWMYDSAGITFVLVLLEWRRRALRRRLSSRTRCEPESPLATDRAES